MSKEPNEHWITEPVYISTVSYHFCKMKMKSIDLSFIYINVAIKNSNWEKKTDIKLSMQRYFSELNCHVT